MPEKSEIRNQKSEIAYRPRLHAAAVAFVILTFCLVILGGTVTSKGVGLSVSDWPTSLHHNMFLLPPSMWQGGIFYEHTHRLLGSLVGLVAIVMAVWLWLTQRTRPWLRWLGVATLGLVIVQGVMGGLRVTEISTSWAVLHGITAQVFLCVTVLIAAATSRFWIERASDNAKAQGWPSPGFSRGPRSLGVALLAVMLVQLILGATMRHTGSGLAIPDFPTAYGHLIPPLDQAAIKDAMSQLPYEQAPVQGYFTPAQVGVHFAHRVWALVVLVVACWLMARTSLAFPTEQSLRGPMVALACLLIAQVALGVMVIWTGRYPEVATAHQATGAATLAVATLLTIRIHVISRSTQHGLRQPVQSPQAIPAFLPPGVKA